MKNNNRNLRNLVFLIKTLWTTDKKYLLLMVFEMLSFSAHMLPDLLITKYTVDALFQRLPFKVFLIRTSLLLVFKLVCMISLAYVNTERPRRDDIVTERLFNQFFYKCMNLEYEKLAEREVQELKDLAKPMADGKIAAVGWYFVDFFSNVFSVAYLSIILFTVKFYLPLVVLVPVITYNMLIKKQVNKMTQLDFGVIQSMRFVHKVYEILSDFTYFKDIKIFNLEGPLIKKAKNHMPHVQSLQEDKHKADRHLSTWHILVKNGVNIGVYLILLLAAFAGSISVGTYVLAVNAVGHLTRSIEAINTCYKKYLDTSKYLDRYMTFMDLPEGRQGQVDLGQNLDPKKGYTIEFKDVSFKYPGREDYVFNQLNLCLDMPQKVSIVGSNGVGKSTFIKLLMGLYKPTSGQILINGVDISSLEEEGYRGLFSTVFQDFELFAFTLRENITAFEEDYSSSKLESVIDQSGIRSRIDDLQEGYDAYLYRIFSKKGQELSGGELQKIALARAIYKDQALISIFDEPTSAIDPKAEYHLYKKYDEIVGGNAAFYISHRLASCKLSDTIIVLKDGQVYEFGSHSDLMAKGDFYSEMFTTQASYYETVSDLSS